ncbi:hypothetical protein BGX34_007527, partial [Mortierella sp. NVP85]
MFASKAAFMAMSMVKNAIRAHYYGAKFGEDGRPANRNAIEYFFAKNKEMKTFHDFPHSKFSPTYVLLTEADLIQILYSHQECKDIIMRIKGWETIAEARKAVTSDKGCLIGTLFYNT